MPKMKTHKGAIMRIFVTATGKIMRKKRTIGSNTKARTQTKRINRKPVQVKKQDVKILKRVLPGI